jgi:hypothetical protein
MQSQMPEQEHMHTNSAHTFANLKCLAAINVHVSKCCDTREISRLHNNQVSRAELTTHPEFKAPTDESGQTRRIRQHSAFPAIRPSQIRSVRPPHHLTECNTAWLGHAAQIKEATIQLRKSFSIAQLIPEGCNLISPPVADVKRLVPNTERAAHGDKVRMQACKAIQTEASPFLKRWRGREGARAS